MVGNPVIFVMRWFESVLLRREKKPLRIWRPTMQYAARNERSVVFAKPLLMLAWERIGDLEMFLGVEFRELVAKKRLGFIQ